MAERHLLTAAEMAARWNCSARSVLRQFEQGRIPGYRISVRRVVFDPSECEQAVKEGGGAMTIRPAGNERDPRRGDR
jgi:hypothetical protein